MSVNGKQIDFRQELVDCSDTDLIIYSKLCSKTDDSRFGCFPVAEATKMINDEMRKRIAEREK